MDDAGGVLTDLATEYEGGFRHEILVLTGLLVLVLLGNRQGADVLRRPAKAFDLVQAVTRRLVDVSLDLGENPLGGG